MTIDRRTMIGAGIALASAPLTTARAAVGSAEYFPRGFLWGAATAGHQVEGNNVNADTWLLENVKPTIYAEPSGDAVNSFELWPEDLDLVKQIGLNTYRFSLEWARIEPEPGMFSIAMLDHYKAMIDGCHKRGLKPFVTFNHYTTPRWFAARGGWTNAESVGLFGRFCEHAAKHLAGGIEYAATLNEPNVGLLIRESFPAPAFAGFKTILDKMSGAAARGSGSSQFVPGNTINVDDFVGLTRNMIAGHRSGRAAIKAVRASLPVGVTLAMPDDQPLGANSVRDAIRKKLYGDWLEAARDDDFLGVQNYERSYWNDKGAAKPKESGGDVNAAGAFLHPDSLANAVRYAYSVARVPIIVTEHGVNTDDDAVRARLIPPALAALKTAIDDGVPVKGYIHWSLLDNFEWIFGYKYHYGLVAVDRKTFRRTLKPSARVYGAIARNNALPVRAAR